MTSPTDFVLTDLHGHSALSDGMTTPEASVRARAEQRAQVDPQSELPSRRPPCGAPRRHVERLLAGR